MQAARKEKIQRDEPFMVKMALSLQLDSSEQASKEGAIKQVVAPIQHLSLGMVPEIKHNEFIATRVID